MMKTSEMYAYAEAHPEAKFKRLSNGVIYCFSGDGELVRSSHHCASIARLNEEWELVREPVTFMEAVNSRKRIKPDGWKEFESLIEIFGYLQVASSPLASINGKWFIE